MTSALGRRIARVEAYGVAGGDGGGFRGRCPECAPARERLWASIFSRAEGDKDAQAPNRCPRCGHDLRITIAEVDRIMHEADEASVGDG